jgi:hypothetical protein
LYIPSLPVIIPAFAGANAAGYTLTFAIVPAHGGPAPILLHSSGYYLDGHANLRIFVRGDDIERRVPGFAPGRRYPVQATLMLTLPTGTGDVRWSDAFIERVFPARERSQSMTKEIEFPGPRSVAAFPQLRARQRPNTMNVSMSVRVPVDAAVFVASTLTWIVWGPGVSACTYITRRASALVL